MPYIPLGKGVKKSVVKYFFLKVSVKSHLNPTYAVGLCEILKTHFKKRQFKINRGLSHLLISDKFPMDF